MAAGSNTGMKHNLLPVQEKLDALRAVDAT